MDSRFCGYKVWKRIKEEIGVFNVYVLPSIIVSQNDIKFAWLFWECCIYYKEEI